jgi:hypothetical protein
MPESWNIRITQQDIDQGVRADCRACPLALAAGRLFPDLVTTAGFSTVRFFRTIDDANDMLSAGLALSCWEHNANDFIVYFDTAPKYQNHPPEPRDVILTRIS